MEASSEVRTFIDVMNENGRASGPHANEGNDTLMTTATITAMDTNTRIARIHPDSAGPFSEDLYRYHGFRVFDRNGERVGIVDWIWTNERTGEARPPQGGESHHIGLQIQWLRGRARAVPAAGAVINWELGIIQVPLSRNQIATAPRFKIDAPLGTEQHATIAAPFGTRHALTVLRR